MNYLQAKLAIENENTSYDTLREAAQLFRDKYEASRKASDAALNVDISQQTLVTTRIRVDDEGGQRYGIDFVCDHPLEQIYIDQIVKSILWDKDYTLKSYMTGNSVAFGYKTVDKDHVDPSFWNPNVAD